MEDKIVLVVGKQDTMDELIEIIKTTIVKGGNNERRK